MGTLLGQWVVSLSAEDLILTLVKEKESGSVTLHGCGLAASPDGAYAVQVDESWAAKTAAQLGVELEVKDGALCVVDSEALKAPRCLDGGDDEAVAARVCAARQICVRCVTWNMAAKATDDPATIRKELLGEATYHVLHVGTQECERSIAASVLDQSKDQWTATLREAVGADYIMLTSHALQATHSIVFVHRALLRFVSSHATAAVATGLGPRDTLRLGNKGGIGVSLTVASTRLLFVTAHLTAHAKKSAQRNAEFHRISADLARAFAKKQASRKESTSSKGPMTNEADDDPQKTKVGEAAADPPGSASLVDLFDAVFWAGDLNYRVDLPREAVDAALSAGDLQTLVDNDQLIKAMLTREVFDGYAEGPLTFPPTYKFDITSADPAAAAPGPPPPKDEPTSAATVDVYDSSAKRRIPSYTDRILVASRQATAHLRDYGAVRSLRTSDHRPVVATFAVDLAIDDAAAYLKAGPNAASASCPIDQRSSQICAIS